MAIVQGTIGLPTPEDISMNILSETRLRYSRAFLAPEIAMTFHRARKQEDAIYSSRFALQMATRDGELHKPARQGDAARQQDRHDEIPRSTHITNNFFAPVNNVGQAKNCNFGTNYGGFGSITNNENWTSPAGPSTRTPVSEDEEQDKGRMIMVPLLEAGHNDLFRLLNPIPDASHTRNRKRSGPDSACFPGTRKKVLKKIRSWANSSLFLGKPHIIWVYGYAGCGKSAIAQAIAEHFSGEERLAASFFFFRGSGDRSRVANFATTVAHQVAEAIPATAPSKDWSSSQSTM
ncbi:hypothetical protein NMY22_g13459 [Coprinellus aureogranulatus]|nr:hypothetical protein NMY22_g13459 [Coprinellus aureogranulatus]